METERKKFEGSIGYNPQLGVRRTIFTDAFDFLLKPCACRVEADCLCMEVETWRGGRALVQVTFLTDTSFRFRMFPPAFYEKKTDCREEMESGADVLRQVSNPVFEFAQSVSARLKETDQRYEYGTDRLTLRFPKEYWEMSVYAGEELLTREQSFDTNVDNRWKCLPTGCHYGEDGRCREVHANMNLFSDEAFWGFGEKFTEFNKRGQLLHCWQKDALSTNTEDSYKSHPFFVSSRGYGIFLNTFTRCSFDMGYTSQVSYQMRAEDGCLDYVLLAAPNGDYREILKQYLNLTGPVPMIPKWAFGFWMSRCSYQSRREVEQVVENCRNYELSVDVIHIDGWQKQENSGTWEWDTERFPDPEGMIGWLRERHVRLSLWMYPYLEEHSPLFSELEEKGYFVKEPEGHTALFYATADSKHHAACFDFTNPEFLEWYKPRVMAVLRMGVAVIKTDFSEAVPENVCFYDGKSGVEGHNRLPYLYAETIYRWMKECGQETGNQPMLWCRSGYAGSHRIPAAWAGDSSGALNNHAAILRGGLSLAMSGVAFWGFDMGGFYNTAANGNECLPSEEEYLRSMELGFFMPLSRAHGKTPREPWNFSERVLETVRKFDRIRHELVPYLYSSACAGVQERLPMLRPLLLEYPEDPVAAYQELSYLLGDALLVAPPFDRKRYRVYLPHGKWANFFTGEIVNGGAFLTLEPGLEELPVFQRENTLIPLLSVKQQEGTAEAASSRQEPVHVPDGSFEKMYGKLFYKSEMNTVFYDRNKEGRLERHSIHVYPGTEDYYLHIDTDMDIHQIELTSEQKFAGICLNGSLL